MGLNMTHMKPVIQKLSALALAVSLTACVSFGAADPPPFLLSLTPDTKIASGAVTSGPKSGALVIEMPDSPKKINVLRVPVQTEGTGIAYLQDAYWVDKPARLFYNLLSETIAAKNNRLVLTASQASGNAEIYLAGELVNFDLDGPSQNVTVTYDAVKLKDGAVVEKKRFEATEYAGSVEPGMVGQAMNRAANKVAADVAEWIG